MRVRVGGWMHCQRDMSPDIWGVCMVYTQACSCQDYEPPTSQSKEKMLKVINMVQYILYKYNNINMLYSQIIKNDKT